MTPVVKITGNGLTFIHSFIHTFLKIAAKLLEIVYEVEPLSYHNVVEPIQKIWLYHGRARTPFSVSLRWGNKKGFHDENNDQSEVLHFAKNGQCRDERLERLPDGD